MKCGLFAAIVWSVLTAWPSGASSAVCTGTIEAPPIACAKDSPGVVDYVQASIEETWVNLYREYLYDYFLGYAEVYWLLYPVGHVGGASFEREVQLMISSPRDGTPDNFSQSYGYAKFTVSGTATKLANGVNVVASLSSTVVQYGFSIPEPRAEGDYYEVVVARTGPLAFADLGNISRPPPPPPPIDVPAPIAGAALPALLGLLAFAGWRRRQKNTGAIRPPVSLRAQGAAT